MKTDRKGNGAAAAAASIVERADVDAEAREPADAARAEGWKTPEIRAALRRRYPAKEYAVLWEVADGTGGALGGWIDALVFCLWPSRGLTLEAFELKASRSDWLRELKNPAKANRIFGFVDAFWIVAGARSIVKPDELPPGWGLLAPRGGELAVVVHAKRLEPPAPDRAFLAAIFRKVQEGGIDRTAIDNARAEGIRTGRASAAIAGDGNRAGVERELRELQRRVREFETASGLEIANGWNMPAVGDALRRMMQDETAARVARDRLERAIADLEAATRRLRADFSRSGTGQ